MRYDLTFTATIDVETEREAQRFNSYVVELIFSETEVDAVKFTGPKEIDDSEE